MHEFTSGLVVHEVQFGYENIGVEHATTDGAPGAPLHTVVFNLDIVIAITAPLHCHINLFYY